MSQDEAHAIEWLVFLAFKDTMIPDACSWCEKPERRGQHFKTQEDRESYILEQKQIYGCIGKAQKKYLFDDGYCLERCPHSIAKESRLVDYFRAYGWLDHSSHLPYGELNELSERYVQIMEIIRTAYRKAEQKRHEESMDKMRAKRNG